MGQCQANPGVWVETVVRSHQSVTLFVSFAALVLASGRFKPIAAVRYFRFTNVFRRH